MYQCTTSDLRKAARKVLEENMGMTEDCGLFILYEDCTASIAKAYVHTANKMCGNVCSVKIDKDRASLHPDRFGEYKDAIDACFDGLEDGQKVALTPVQQRPEEVGFRIKLIDYLTGHFGKTNHTHRGRLGHQPGINERMMMGPMTADYRQVAKDAKVLYQLIKDGKKARLRGPNGTDLEIGLPGPRYWEKDDGMIMKPGAFGNLPAGELFCHPVPERTNGILVFSSVTGIGKPPKPVRLEFKKGMVVGVESSNSDEAVDYHNNLVNKEFGNGKKSMHRRTIGELGIGLNPMAKLSYPERCEDVKEMLEAEKVMGTVHVATGQGRKNRSDTHVDYLIENPILEVDDMMIILDGKHAWKGEF